MGRNAVAFEAKDSDELVKPGAYRFWQSDDGKRGITFGCPCGCGGRFGMSIKNEAGAGWTVVGEWPKVTADPSLGCNNQYGPGYHWHGYLRSGVFEEC
jgi:hypothetical protein